MKAHRNYYRTLKTGRGDNQKLLNELQAIGLAKVSESALRQLLQFLSGWKHKFIIEVNNNMKLRH